MFDYIFYTRYNSNNATAHMKFARAYLGILGVIRLKGSKHFLHNLQVMLARGAATSDVASVRDGM